MLEIYNFSDNFLKAAPRRENLRKTTSILSEN